MHLCTHLIVDNAVEKRNKKRTTQYRAHTFCQNVWMENEKYVINYEEMIMRVRRLFLF